MASTKERKKEVDSEIKHLDSKNMRRGKPQQLIYRPGSGPLRKSAQGIDETESDTNIVLNCRQNHTKHSTTDRTNKLKSAGSSPRDTNAIMEATTAKLGDMSIVDKRKEDTRKKKPEQSFYVPRQFVQPRDDRSPNPGEMNPHDRYTPPIERSPQVNGEDNFNNSNLERVHNPGRSKRYLNRRTSQTSDVQEEWRSPGAQSSRNMRQGSEPRAMSNQNSYSNRMRDTRSVEPFVMPQRGYAGDKMNAKPPSGRRHSTNGLEADKRIKNLDNLAPRFKKKFLESNLTAGNYPRNEEQWDGSSITFQGSQQQNYGQKQNYQGYSTLPSGLHHQHVQNHHQNNMMYHTLPNNRSRGRGRLPKEFDNQPSGYQSVPLEKAYKMNPSDSRAPTPPLYLTQACGNDGYKGDDVRRFNDNRRFTEDRYRNDDKFRTNEDKYRSNEDKYRSNEDKYRSNEDKFRTSEDKYRNNENKYRNNENKCRNSETNYKYKLEKNNSDKSSNQNGASTNLPEKCSNEVDGRTTPRAFRESLEALLSPVSPPTPPEKEIKTVVPINNMILDWSEEVELNDRLEAEALSDALTRSSSIASLMEISTKSLPPTTSGKKSKKRKSKSGRKRSGSRNRDRSVDTQNSNKPRRGIGAPNDQNLSRQNSVNSNDNFKQPEQRPSRNAQVKLGYDQNVSREPSFDRGRKSSCSEQENWRDEIRVRQSSERDSDHKDGRKGGLIVLPQPVQETPKAFHNERPKYPDINRKVPCQKTLFDPNNPNKPIIVKSPTTRVAVPGFSDNTETPPPQLYTTDQFGNMRPGWYDESSDKWKICRFPDLLRDVIKADNELQYIITSGHILINWGAVVRYRGFLMQSLAYLLCNDIKFCQSENVEHHFWKILFYNIMEMMRKAIASDAANRDQYKGFVLNLIDEGTKYFERLLDSIEETYSFKINSFLGNHATPQKGKYVGLALISTQKIFLYLGDLLRYREQVNETTNYGKCRQWYIKAHEVNPKNGKPYNQLALLAVYARRKLDAVYYYMRSLTSSNPVQSAKESLVSLFDENRKKYEQGERKKREERLERARQHMKEKESEAPVAHPNSLRREIWIRPDGGRRVHRTTSAVQEHQQLDSEEEDLAALSSVEVNKRFVTSYLHVHGKLITKIGMESFQESALQMLKEFRALLQHSPVPLPCNRFLQLLALNMFAIESTQLKATELNAASDDGRDPQLQSQSGYRSELQERALVISLQMFSLILERCVSLLQEHAKCNAEHQSSLPQDVQILLPAVKIWCDWMQCNSGIWNPPPSTQDYKVGAPGDAWSRIASLMNLLEKIEKSAAAAALLMQPREGCEQVRLPEDAVLSGFTPLMHNVQKPTYVPKELDMEAAQFALRLNKLLFFGTVFLCGLEPPVLKVEIQNNGCSEYVSVVRTSSSRSLPPSPPELNDDNDLLVESFSEDEDDPGDEKIVDNASSEVRDLLSRKVELEKRHRHQEIHRQRVQKILQQSVVSIHIEVRPKYLIPDTNCFIDYLEMIKTVASAHVYTLMVPLVVLNELEGLGRGGKTPAPTPKGTPNTEHAVKVAESAKHALEFLSVKDASVKCITTKGTILPSSTFTVEDDSAIDSVLKNDDKILLSCLTLCKGTKDQHVEGEPRKLYREVVLLTEDRNLRVKALARDVPVRELPDFIRWAGLG